MNDSTGSEGISAQGVRESTARGGSSSPSGFPLIQTDSIQKFFFPADSRRFLTRTVPVCLAALATFVGSAAYYGKLIEPGTLGFFSSINFRFPLITLLFAFVVNYYLGRYDRSIMRFLTNAAHGNGAERRRSASRIQAMSRGQTRPGSWLRWFRWAIYVAAVAGWLYLYVYRPIFTDFALGDWESPDHPLAFFGFAGWYFVLWVLILGPAMNALVTALYAVVRAPDESEGRGTGNAPRDAGAYLRGFRSLGDALWMSELVLLLPLLFLVPSVLLYHSERALIAIAAYSLAVGVLVSMPLWRLHKTMEVVRRDTPKHLGAADGGTPDASSGSSEGPDGADLDQPYGQGPSWPMGPARLAAFIACFLIPAIVALLLL